MKTTLVLAVLTVLSISIAFSATTIRFSEVCPADAPDSTSMKLAAYDEIVQVKNEAMLTNKDIQSSFPYKDTHYWGVSITLTPESAKRFDVALENMYQKRLAIIVDGKLVSAPTIRLHHANGKLQITGKLSESEATRIATGLNGKAVKQDASINP
jgi:preprotein translocase subunit SecD